jgi:hypothetical protein
MLIREFTCFAAGTNGGNPALTVEDGPGQGSRGKRVVYLMSVSGVL